MEAKTYKCKRCKYVWISRLYNGGKPKCCPCCKSAKYDTPRKKAILEGKKWKS